MLHLFYNLQAWLFSTPVDQQEKKGLQNLPRQPDQSLCAFWNVNEVNNVQECFCPDVMHKHKSKMETFDVTKHSGQPQQSEMTGNTFSLAVPQGKLQTVTHVSNIFLLQQHTFSERDFCLSNTTTRHEGDKLTLPLATKCETLFF